MSKSARSVPSMNHPCYELAGLAKRSHRCSRDWTDSLKRLEALNGPFGTGKEIAITIHSLSKVPNFVRWLFTDQIAELFVRKSISSIVHEMNETSIAITGLSVCRLPSLSPSLLAEFGVVLCGLERSRGWSDPRNLAQVCYAIGVLPGIPIGVRSEALGGWVSSAILSFTPHRFKVKDIVQILTGYSSHRIENEPVLSLIEKIILLQVQYCDSLAIGAILNCFGKLNHEPSRSVVGALLATAAQHQGHINAQSFCGILRVLQNVTLDNPERVKLHQLVDASLGIVLG